MIKKGQFIVCGQALGGGGAIEGSSLWGGGAI